MVFQVFDTNTPFSAMLNPNAPYQLHTSRKRPFCQLRHAAMICHVQLARLPLKIASDGSIAISVGANANHRKPECHTKYA
jgi:hypothetical protein